MPYRSLDVHHYYNARIITVIRRRTNARDKKPINIIVPFTSVFLARLKEALPAPPALMRACGENVYMNAGELATRY